MNKNNIPKVSVCVITYNHENYLTQCLQGILDQKTIFEFEVIVSDDCSTDGTRKIIEEFTQKYPGKIVPVLHETKVGGNFNFIDCHNRAKGMYVAHVDGDDLVLPNKLQTQADYLDNNPDCSVVWHRMNIFDDEGTFCIPNIKNINAFVNGKVLLRDVLQFGSVSFHSSTMYRAKARLTRFSEVDLLDWYYSVEYLKLGYGKYLNEILGSYRYSRKTITRKDSGENRVQSVLS